MGFGASCVGCLALAMATKVFFPAWASSSDYGSATDEKTIAICHIGNANLLQLAIIIFHLLIYFGVLIVRLSK